MSKLEIEEPMLKFFKYQHLKPELQTISRPFCELAEAIAEGLPPNDQRHIALQKLLEAKDAAVRATL
jgi:hypothetical protein